MAAPWAVYRVPVIGSGYLGVFIFIVGSLSLVR